MSMHKELSVKSRVRGDFHARFCERVRVKLPRSTRPYDSCIFQCPGHGDNGREPNLHHETPATHNFIRGDGRRSYRCRRHNTLRRLYMGKAQKLGGVKWRKTINTHNFHNTLKSASNLNGNLNCSKELEHYAS